MTAIESAHAELSQALAPERILSDPLESALYARDASMFEGGCTLVALPVSTEEVAACLRIARDHQMFVVPRGSGTGLAGAAVPFGNALVVATTKMNRVLEIRTEDRLAWVQPGIVNLDLVEELRPLGYTFAPDPSSQQVCSVGGNVGTNAGGPHCLAYGVTSSHILAIEIVLPDGTVEVFGSEGPEWPGYDLRGLVVGSEGTLGIVTRVCVRLVPLAPAVRTMLLDFPTVEDCAATVSAIIAAGVIPAALEMMDQLVTGAIENYVHAGYPTDAAAVLLVEVDGLAESVKAQALEVASAAHGNNVRNVRVAETEAERELLWKGRKSAFGATAQIAPDYHLHDCVVPRTKLAAVLTDVYEIVRRNDLKVLNVFHAGDGNLHPLLVFDRREPGALDRVLRASEEIVRLCVQAGGALSGEHGIGLEKRDFMHLVFNDTDLGAQACLRDAFDPEGRMNPQKVLPSSARCGDHVVLRGNDAAPDELPEGTWI